MKSQPKMQSSLESAPKVSSDSASMEAREKEAQIATVELELGLPSWTPEEKHRLDMIYRKLDLRIIPALWCMYFLTSFGSNVYGVTLTMNREDGHSLGQKLKLTAHDTSTASALYYVGYIIFDVPINLVMTKVSPQSWLARIVITVGLVYTCYQALDNAKGLKAVRFISGMVGAGTWPGLSYYVSLWYPNDRQTRRIGYYYTAAQLSAAAAGLVSAGFQKMDGDRGYTGWQWMYLVYGCVTMAVGISLLWWLPDRPNYKYNEKSSKISQFYHRFFTTKHPLNEKDRLMHLKDIEHRYKLIKWTLKDVVQVMTDLRVWFIILMYFGAVGTGFGLAVFGSTIIAALNPSLSSINVSLLYAPIWLFDLGGILLITPFADRYKKHRAFFFCGACVVIMVGLFVTTFAKGFWNRWAGLLISGFGLGPTIPICMSWSAELFGPRYGDVGNAVSAAIVSGLGNLGSVTATYALYSGWPSDKARLYRNSNMTLVGMLGISVVSALTCHVLKDKIRQK